MRDRVGFIHQVREYKVSKSQIDYAALGQRGGIAKEAKAADERRRYAESMPSLDSPENCKRRLEIINDMAVRGLLPGSIAGSAVRACEAWLKAYTVEQDRQRIRELETTVERLEAQLAARSVRRVG